MTVLRLAVLACVLPLVWGLEAVLMVLDQIEALRQRWKGAWR